MQHGISRFKFTEDCLYAFSKDKYNEPVPYKWIAVGCECISLFDVDLPSYANDVIHRLRPIHGEIIFDRESLLANHRLYRIDRLHTISLKRPKTIKKYLCS